MLSVEVVESAAGVAEVAEASPEGPVGGVSVLLVVGGTSLPVLGVVASAGGCC